MIWTIAMYSARRLLLLLLPAMFVAAQTPTGQFTGQVNDPSGSSIAGAKITTTNVATGVSRDTVSNETGNYTVPLLPPGSYRIEVQKDGFRPIAETGYTLNVDQIVRADFSMKLGSSVETVQVAAETPMLDTETAAMGAVIDNQKVSNLPLNQRNVFRLALLAPGVVAAPGFGDQFNTASGFRINGGRANQNEIMIDGVSNSMSAANPILVVAIFPSPDALQEFKVQTNVYAAEYGRTAGGIVNMAMKSGTNRFHGSAYEFLRNSLLDSNNFFANRSGTPLASFKRNQFGGTVGGPIKKDKAFFFVSYEGLRLRAASNATRTVPTDLQRTGNFSGTSALVGGSCLPVQVYDPVSTVPNPSGSGFIRSQFPGNAVPVSRLDPVGTRIATYYPRPNTPGAACTRANNFFVSRATVSDINQVDGRGDWAPTEKDRAFLSLSWRKREDVNPNLYGNAAETNAGIFGDDYPAGAARLDYTRIQTPSLIFDFRAGASRLERHFNQQPDGFNLTTLGFPTSLAQQVQGPQGFPQISVTGYGAMGNGVSNTDQTQTLYSFNASGTWIKGKHSVKFGIDARVNQAFEYSTFSNTGTFTFTQGFTQGPDPNAPRADRGNGLASLLLGTGSGFAQIVPPILTSSPYYGVYIQDTYKITSKLTLNLGLRYDLEQGRTERHNQLSYFDFHAPSPLAARIPSLPNLQGGLQFVGGQNGNRQFNTDANNFGPRFGFAYSPKSDTVVRGGYGLFYVPFVGVAAGTASGINGFLSTTTWVNSVNGLNPLNYLSNPFPTGLTEPTGSSLGLLTSVGQTLGATRDGAIDRGSKVGYSQQWSFSIQQQLPGSMSIEAAYVGSKGTHLMDNGWQLNQLNPMYLSLGTALQQTVANPFAGVIASGQLSLPTVTRQQLLLPYPQYLGLYDYRPAAASSIYHSFQLSLQKRFSSGSSLLISYTGGKLIDDSTGTNIGSGGTAPEHLNAYDRSLDRAVSSQDVSRNLVASFVYAIPFGRGKRFGAHLPAVVDKVFANWEVNGIVTYSTGIPLTLSAPNNTNANSSTQRPNILRDAALPGDRATPARLQQWFDTTAFAQPAAFTFGNAPRTLPDVRSDSLKNVDFSLFKEFPFLEHNTVQLRAESFNGFNTPQFGVPGTVLGASDFGVVNTQANNPRQIQFGLRVIF